MSNYAQDVFTKHAGRIQDVSSPQAEMMRSLLSDCARMTWEFYPAISVACLQVHHHVVPFLPVESRLTQAYGARSLSGIEVKEGRKQTWSPCVRVLDGRFGGCLCVAFSPDGGRVTTGAFDHTVGLWSVQTGALLQVMTGHSDNVCSIMFSADGRRIVSGSDDHTVRI